MSGIFLDYPFPLPKLPPGLDYNHEMNSATTLWVRLSDVLDKGTGGICRACTSSKGDFYLRVVEKDVWKDGIGRYPTQEDAVNAMVAMLWLGVIEWRKTK